MTLANYLFGFRGRINRAKWWVFLFPFAAGICVVEFLVVPMRVGFAVWLILMLPLWYAWVAVGVKRLHDVNKPAVWVALLYGVPIVIWLYRGYVTWSATQAGLMLAQARTAEEMQTAAQAVQEAQQGMAAHMGSLAWVLVGVEIVFMVWAIIELGCVKGTTGDNRYGPDPLAGKTV